MRPEMNIGAYQRYLQQYVQEAVDQSDGTPSGILEYLGTIKITGWFVRDKTEKQRAVQDAIKAFQEHRHWPIDIIYSHLGVTIKKS